MEDSKPLWMVTAGAEAWLADDTLWPTHGQETFVSREQQEWGNSLHVLRREGGHSWVCQTCGWSDVE